MQGSSAVGFLKGSVPQGSNKYESHASDRWEGQWEVWKILIKDRLGGEKHIHQQGQAFHTLQLKGEAFSG